MHMKPWVFLKPSFDLRVLVRVTNKVTLQKWDGLGFHEAVERLDSRDEQQIVDHRRICALSNFLGE